MKKFLLVGLFSIGLFTTTFAAYTPTASDIAITEKFSQKIEEKVKEKGDIFRVVIVDLLEKLIQKTASERYKYIFGAIKQEVSTDGVSSVKEMLPLGEVLGLTMDIQKAWTGEKIGAYIQVNEAGYGFGLPLNISIQNSSDKDISLPCPIVEGGSFPVQAPAFVVACHDGGPNTLGFTNRYFEFNPGIIANGRDNGMGYKVLENYGRTDNQAGAGAKIVATNKNGLKPRLTLGSEETVGGEFTITCGLFVNQLAGNNNCGCELNNENPGEADIECFKSCYAENGLEGDRDYISVWDYSNPGTYWTKVDEDNLTIAYTGQATYCDFGCDRNYTFRIK